MRASFLSDPESACYAIWIAWALSWWLAALWSSRTESRVSMAEQLPYRLLNIAGFVLLFGVNTPSHRSSWRLWTLPTSAGWGLAAVCALGFAFAWWARLHLGRLWSGFVTRKTGHRIIDTGPYGIVRHPIYSGIILAAFALAIEKGTVFALLGAFVGSLGFWVKARLEEGFLREQLGADAYDSYRRRVPMLLPFGPP